MNVEIRKATKDAGEKEARSLGYQKTACLVTAYKDSLIHHYEKIGYVLTGEILEMFGSTFTRMVKELG